MSDPAPIVPETLPEKPDGWTVQTMMHLSMSDKKHGRWGQMARRIKDPEGNPTIICNGYNSHPVDGWQGFYLEGEEDGTLYKSWAELRAAWPEILAKHKSKL